MAVVGWGLTGVGAATAVGGAVLGSLSTGEYYGLLDENGHTRLELCETGGGFAPSGDARCAKELAPDERDRVTILAFQNQLLSQATVAFVVGGVGLLVAATGAALALTAGGEAADDSAASAAR